MKKGHKGIALFCGAGGLSLGFKRAGFDIIFATDADADAIASYKTFFPTTEVRQSDIRLLDPAALPPDIDILLGHVLTLC